MKSRHLSSNDAELTPLYVGYGTHISYIYVGNPSQRQSVIIDTGSVYTAFPCTGCVQCGEHTDQYYEPKNSTTSVIPKCGLSTCSLSQSYSEGSSWRAYKVIDEVYVGGASSDLVHTAPQYKVNFTFGCQTSETGLFRTQLADGIMGLARSPLTLPYLLQQQGVTSTKLFALCYRVGGGIMTIGGVDQTIHLSNIIYSPLTNAPSGWYGIWIKEISLREKTETEKKYPLSINEKMINSGSGIIVDSGTTDTYLPSIILQEFSSLFERLTGLKYHNNGYQLTDEQIHKMPDIIFTIRDVTDPTQEKTFDLVMPVTSYADIDSKGRYIFRVYLTENSGGVLGSNFMNNYNIIFDSDGSRLGFAISTCNYDQLVLTPTPPFFPPPPVVITPLPIHEDDNGTDCLLKPLTYCTARCNRDQSEKNYLSYGNQSYLNECTKEIEIKSCHELCRKDNTIARGYDTSCLSTSWTECSEHCKQYRTLVTTDGKEDSAGKGIKCKKIQQERDCFVDECPLSSEDFFILSDWKYKYEPVLPPGHWDKIYEEDLFVALSQLLKIPEGNLDILVDTTRSNEASNEDDPHPNNNNKLEKYLKLQVQITIPRRTFSRVEYFNNKIDSILTYLTTNGQTVGSHLIPILEQISSAQDQDSLHRYVLMKSNDLTCQRAVALPMNSERGENYLPPEISKKIPNSGSNGSGNGQVSSSIYLISISVGSLLVMIGMCALYWKLRAEYAAISKDKVLSGGSSMIQMWNSLKNKSKQLSTNSLPTNITKKTNIASLDVMSTKNLLNENREASSIGEEEDEEYGL